MNYKLVLGGLLVAVHTLSVAAPIELSLKDAVSRALSKHESIKIAEMDKDAAKAGRLTAVSSALPNVDASYDRVKFRMWGALSSTDVLPQGWTEQYAVTATQPIFTFGKISSGISMANKGVEAARYGVTKSKKDIVLATKVKYFSVLLSKRLLEINQESYQNALKNRKSLLGRSRFGRSSKADQIKMKLDVSTRVPELNRAKVRYDSEVAELKELLRIPDEEKLILTNTPADARFYKLGKINIKESLNKDPEFKMISKSLEISKMKVNNKTAGFFPDVAAFAQYNPIRYSADSELDEKWKKNMNVGVGVTFSFGGGKVGSYREAVAQKYKSEYAMRLKKSSFEVQLSKLISTYDALLDTRLATLKTLKLAEQTYKMSESLFKAGKMTQTYLNDRELDLTRVKIGLADIVFNIHAIRAQIKSLASMEEEL